MARMKNMWKNSRIKIPIPVHSSVVPTTCLSCLQPTPAMSNNTARTTSKWNFGTRDHLLPSIDRRAAFGPCLWCLGLHDPRNPLQLVWTTQTGMVQHPCCTAARRIWQPIFGMCANCDASHASISAKLSQSELEGVSDWLQEFKRGLVDKVFQKHRGASNSCHELPLEH